MEIRKLTADETADALNLVREIVLSDPGMKLGAEGKRSVLQFADRHSTELCWYGAYEGELTGTAAIDDNAHLALLFVREEYRHKGIAGELVHTVCREVRKRGNARLSVHAAEPAIAFYEHLGFMLTDTLQEKDGIRYLPMELYIQNRELGRTVTVTVDRPYGSFHPSYADIRYLCNYGYVEEVLQETGEFQDAYVYGPEEALEHFTGIVIAVIYRREESTSVWVVSADRKYDKQAVIDAVAFQEQFCDIYIEWLKD